MSLGNALEETKNREFLREVERAINTIAYGSVEVLIQDFRVIQIEIKEKVRFERDGRRKGKQ